MVVLKYVNRGLLNLRANGGWEAREAVVIHLMENLRCFVL